MVAEWDPKKAVSNFRKHGVPFADSFGRACDRYSRARRRGRTVGSIGSDPAGRLLIVVYTLMPHRIRIISARRATGRERIQYEEKP